MEKSRIVEIQKDAAWKALAWARTWVENGNDGIEDAQDAERVAATAADEFGITERVAFEIIRDHLIMDFGVEVAW